jgi:hypothetical protein
MPHLGERYSPLYFLAALGTGGLVVTFFMWMLFWVPHPGRPVPVFEDIAAALAAGPLARQIAILGAWAGIAVFGLMKIRLLVWNLSEYAHFRRTPAHAALRRSNAETQLLAAPLTVAMAVNVGFILGLVFVPGLWGAVEYLFPLALLAFLAIGAWALRLMGDFWGRILTTGEFDCTKNNSFGQLLPAFALAMVGVGLAAPAAMSATPWIAGVSVVASSLFIVMAVLTGAVKLFLGVRAMMEHGATAESAPTLWIVVPIVTVVTIATMRQDHGLHVHFGAVGGPAELFLMLTQYLSVQVAFALFGWVLLKRFGYFGRFVIGAERSPGSYALVCPGVALVVMLQFWLNKGLVGAGVVEKFGPAWIGVTVVALALQAATIWLVLTLNAKHFRPEAGRTVATPAE